MKHDRSVLSVRYASRLINTLNRGVRISECVTHLGHDPSEQYNVNEKHSEVLAQIEALVKEHRQHLRAPASQLEVPLTTNRD